MTKAYEKNITPLGSHDDVNGQDSQNEKILLKKDVGENMKDT